MCMLSDSKSLEGKLLAIHISQLSGSIQTILYSAKLWSNAHFAPQIHGAFILCPAKLWSNADFATQNYGVMQTLPRKIMGT